MFRAHDFIDLLALRGEYPVARRRLDRALDYLETFGFLERRAAARGWRHILMFSEDRASAWSPNPESPRSYRPPRAVSPLPPGDQHVIVPAAFWMNGWGAVLPGDATVVLLAMRYLRATRREHEQGLFLTPSFRNRRFGFSEDIWYRGRKALVQMGLASLHREKVRSRSGDLLVRQTLSLHDGALEDRPDQER